VKKARRDQREEKHFPLFVGFAAKSHVKAVIEKPKLSPFRF